MHWSRDLHDVCPFVINLLPLLFPIKHMLAISVSGLVTFLFNMGALWLFKYIWTTSLIEALYAVAIIITLQIMYGKILRQVRYIIGDSLYYLINAVIGIHWHRSHYSTCSSAIAMIVRCIKPNMNLSMPNMKENMKEKYAED